MQTKKTQDLISVIIPIYNMEKYLTRCVDTILGQTYSNMQILLVDDNKISRDVSEKLLTNTGATVVKAENGQQALDQYIAAGGAFDLILMEVLMPVMDGLTTARRIRSL